jgi:hypothetical protein
MARLSFFESCHTYTHNPPAHKKAPSIHPPPHPPTPTRLPQLKGFLYNNGTAAACDVRVRAVDAPGVIELWPEWGPNSAYEKFFNPKQVRA